ncbi:hypothetical protein XBI1_2510017 [Xenorhabdus bovienii str. Intermedium]|uniref:Uncharacterized protein n=1 Tax=Xenorhabdus bovienii str. Intermedium TaxID=1379677 RepID=A0A077QAN0_XENBV|nr:hypothetical protein XBI1_2510017 [Xenorhabdus bovienii str. Intermedium]
MERVSVDYLSSTVLQIKANLSTEHHEYTEHIRERKTTGGKGVPTRGNK